MLIKHLYENVNGVRRPFATLVAVPDSEYGFSLGLSVCRDDERFNKQMGIKIASGRARCYSPASFIRSVLTILPQHRYVRTNENNRVPISEIVQSEVDKMIERASRYFV